MRLELLGDLPTINPTLSQPGPVINSVLTSANTQPSTNNGNWLTNLSNGITNLTNTVSTVKQTVDNVKQVFKPGTTTPVVQSPGNPPEVKKDNTALYTGIAVAGGVVITTLLLTGKKKKKSVGMGRVKKAKARKLSMRTTKTKPKKRGSKKRRR